MGIQLKVRNFRCLRNVDWSPNGVCVLVGPNGAGKSTLFDALNFLRLAYIADPSKAVSASGGPFFRNLDAPPGVAVGFILTQGTHSWELGITFGGGPFDFGVVERFIEDHEVVVSTSPSEGGVSFRGLMIGTYGGLDSVTALRVVANMPGNQNLLPSSGQTNDPPANYAEEKMTIDQRLPRLREFISTLSGFAVYGTYALHQLRQSGSQVSADTQLALNGMNAFTVLRNWRDKRDFRAAYDFVAKQVCNAFPGVSDELDFDFAGTITSLRLVNSKRKESIPVTFAPNGWLAGLLHLMAVAGARTGTVVAIDEFENSLHPYAIRRLVQAMREWAAKRDLTVILAGHSPALLDEFAEQPSQVYVMEPWHSGQPSMPLRLTDYRDPEWLKHFSLGELYRHEDFGGPKDALTNSVPAESAS